MSFWNNHQWRPRSIEFGLKTLEDPKHQNALNQKDHYNDSLLYVGNYSDDVSPTKNPYKSTRTWNISLESKPSIFPNKDPQDNSATEV